MPDIFAWDVEDCGPFTHRTGDALECQHSDVASIPCLFGSCGPAAVFGRIWSIVVGAFDAVVARWRLAHVVAEVLIDKPTFAYGNSAAAVLFEVFVITIAAAVQHAHPNAM